MMQLEFPFNDWRPMFCAPVSRCQDVEVWDGTRIVVSHFAQDLSGEDQPPFSGWFIPIMDDHDRVLYYTGIKPLRWRPIT